MFYKASEVLIVFSMFADRTAKLLKRYEENFRIDNDSFISIWV